MPKVLAIDPKRQDPVIVYVHEKQSNTRIQLLAEDDIRDARGRLMTKGRTVRADFVRGKFATNIPEYIALLEDSIAYKAGRVEKLETLTKRANDQLLANVLKVVEDNPELAKELRSKLTSKQIAAAKAKKVEPKAAKAAEPEEDEADEAVDLYSGADLSEVEEEE